MRFTNTILAILLAVLTLSVAAKPFRIVLLPDTQSYCKEYPDMFYAQTAWIAANAGRIAFVLQQGDIVNDYDQPAQWDVAVKAMSAMDGKVPYAFVAGNHDFGVVKNADSRVSVEFNERFPYSKYSAGKHFRGAYEPGKMDNTWHAFHAGGRDWLVLCLELGPRDSVLRWAGEVVASHPKHKVIVNTHAYMYADDTRMGPGARWLPSNYGIGKAETANNGEQMWEKFVSKYPNIAFVFSGHVLLDGTGLLVSEGEKGNKVVQILANYQNGVKGSENGGNAYLRILDIDPAKGTLDVQTYSPALDRFRTEPDQKFRIENLKL